MILTIVVLSLVVLVQQATFFWFLIVWDKTEVDEAGDAPEAWDMPDPIDTPASNTVEPHGAEYSVSGVPLRVPWSVRRKGLEEASRTKRRAQEEFREA